MAELSARTDGKGDLSYSILNDELTKEFGEKGTGYNISDEDEEIWIIKVGNVEYNINNPNITQTPTEPTDEFDAIRTKIAKENGDCMIDIEGTIMSIETWNWEVVREGECQIIATYIEEEDNSPGASAYKNGSFNVDGTLKYKIPVLIKSNDVIYKMTSVGFGALYGLDNLKIIDIPNSVTSIGDYAFQWCTNLNTITIPNSVNFLGYRIFEECGNLKEINIPNSVVNTLGYIFFNWNSSQTINIQFKEEELPEGWEYDWNSDCNAIINYIE